MGQEIYFYKLNEEKIKTSLFDMLNDKEGVELSFADYFYEIKQPEKIKFSLGKIFIHYSC
jgi:hypothetical protein